MERGEPARACVAVGVSEQSGGHSLTLSLIEALNCGCIIQHILRIPPPAQALVQSTAGCHPPVQHAEALGPGVYPARVQHSREVAAAQPFEALANEQHDSVGRHAAALLTLARFAASSTLTTGFSTSTATVG